MSDYAFQLLQRTMLEKMSEIIVQDQPGPQPGILWLVDENISPADIASMPVTDNLQALTNRCDLYDALNHRGINAVLNDFDITVFEKKSFAAVFYRVSKEKAIVHHLINTVPDCLSDHGELWLAGFKNEGIKTYIDKAAKYLGEVLEKQRGNSASHLACVELDGKLREPLDDKNYRSLIELNIDISGTEITLLSKPGVYGWNKIDKGSTYLVEQLNDFFQHYKAMPETVIDLGCGFGYLSVLARQLCPAYYLATDNNVASVELCRQNFQRHQLSGEVVLADCGEGLQQKAELVLCNPPFHQGFDVEGDLTQRFLVSARRLLAPGGKALFVVNSFIPLEKKARGIFNTIDMLANNGSFKVLCLS